MQVIARSLELPLAETFSIARWSSDSTRVVQVEVEHQGLTGVGEGSPVDYWGETPAAMVAFCSEEAPALLGEDPWALDPERIACPVRIVWGTADALLPWPSAARRHRELLWHADWVELDGVGHAPQLEVPLEAAQLVLGVSAG